MSQKEVIAHVDGRQCLTMLRAVSVTNSSPTINFTASALLIAQLIVAFSDQGSRVWAAVEVIM